MQKKVGVLFVVLFLVVFSSFFVSASWLGDLFNSITGKATTVNSDPVVVVNFGELAHVGNAINVGGSLLIVRSVYNSTTGYAMDRVTFADANGTLYSSDILSEGAGRLTFRGIVYNLNYYWDAVNDEGSVILYASLATCVDSDGGLNYYVVGNAGRPSQTHLNDLCQNSSVLGEAICLSDGTTTYSLYACPNGCSNGACLNSTPQEPTITGCTDTDGGLNYYKFGRLMLSLSNGTSFYSPEGDDYCLSFTNPSDTTGGWQSLFNCSGSNCYVGEHNCSNYKSAITKYQCLNGCSNGACINASQLSCFDAQSDVSIVTDAGYTCVDRAANNLSIQIRKGPNTAVNLAAVMIIAFNGGSSEVFRINKTNNGPVIFGNLPGNNEFKLIVLNKASLSNTTNIKIAPVIVSGSGELVCEATQQVVTPSCSVGTPSCFDSDGINYYVKGNFSGMYNGSYVANSDACLSYLNESGDDVPASNYLGEGYCQDDQLKIQRITCPGGCVDGVCLNSSQPPVSCTDSDGGINYNVQGTTINDTYKEQDSCFTKQFGSGNIDFVSSCVGTNNYSCGVSEYYCSGASVNLAADSCISGCSNGACVNVTVTKPTCASGCALNKSCVSVGYRINSGYCALNSSFASFNKDNSACNNNFECSSNICASNQCISSSFWNSIISWFKKLFGRK